ncbi:MAG: hypothetical protein Ct9H300mP1_35450 [Planctomycetaceae bacterium]|nr:MAG: hypothetical protein Ct9H300mP1_35450 [Planctomycetaceae bacterium]
MQFDDGTTSSRSLLQVPRCTPEEPRGVTPLGCDDAGRRAVTTPAPATIGRIAKMVNAVL